VDEAADAGGRASSSAGGRGGAAARVRRPTPRGVGNNEYYYCLMFALQPVYKELKP
jgi:hypothetical protein